MTRRSEAARALLAACLATVACRGACVEPEAGRAGEPEAGAVSLEVTTHAADPGIVLHDCNGLEPSIDARCAHGVEPGDMLLQRAEVLTEIAAMHMAPDEPWWDGFEAAVDATERVRTDALGRSERVALQNAALFLALEAKSDRKRLADRAMVLVKRLAFPPDARPGADDPDPALDDWLGPRVAWVERTREGGPAFHQSVHHSTRLFRLVRTASLRANFSQLVAVDANGEPFVTGVVGSLETRRGFDAASRACVALPSAERLRCGASAGLEAVRDVSTLPRSHLFDRDEHASLRCNSCHVQGSAFTEVHDLSSAAAATDLAARRTALLAHIRAELAPLWSHGR
jgi:hypothetical protein